MLENAKLTAQTKESLKTALAMTLVYAISLQLGWDRPYWAGFAVAFCSLATVGQSLNKSSLRLLGTVMAAIVALTVLSFTSQDRWLFITLLSLWCGFCTYMMSGSRNPYFWHVSAFVFVIICIDGGPQPDNAFSIAALRLQQTGLGILVYGLVSVFIWPISSRQPLDATASSILECQSTLLQYFTREFYENTKDPRAKEVYGQYMAEETQFENLLAAALVDTESVRNDRAAWEMFQARQSSFVGALQQWREGFRDLNTDDMRRIFPKLEDFTSNLLARFDPDKVMSDSPESDALLTKQEIELDVTVLKSHSHFEIAAMSAAIHTLRQLDELSIDMLTLWRDIAVDKLHAAVTPDAKPQDTPVALDLERLLASAKVVLILWLAFIIVIYVPDFPGDFALLATTGPIAVMMFNMPQTPVRSTYVPTVFGLAFGSFFYILIMPHLSSFLGLGSMIFMATFFLCYFFYEPQKMLGRLLGLAMFLSTISISNEQSYSILSVITTAQLWLTLFILMAIVNQLPYSSRPEKVILRLLKRYFKSVAYVLEHPQFSDVGKRAKLKQDYHQRVVAKLPVTLFTWAGSIDPQALGDNSAQQLPVMLNRVHALSFRIQELVEARAMPQSREVAELLSDDMHAWRRELVRILEELVDVPDRRQKAERSDFNRHSELLQKRIKLCLEQYPLSEQERYNFYRILNSFRGASNAMLDYIDEASRIDWETWQQERFA